MEISEKCNIEPLSNAQSQMRVCLAAVAERFPFQTLLFTFHAFVAALTVKYMTGRFIGEYDPDMGE
jgi:hypothetical protein